MESRQSRQPLNHRASEQTLISLLELDPSPIDSPSPTEGNKKLELQEDDAANTSTSTGTATAPGLSGNGHGAIYYLSRIQRYSSYAMSVFTSLHLANVSLIPAMQRSVAASETYLLMTREIYQTSLMEPLLVALPVVAHIGSGIALRLLRHRQNVRRYGGATPAMYALHRSRGPEVKTGGGAMHLWPPLSYISASGYAFSVLYAAHVFMNRLLPLAVEGGSSDIGLAYVAHGFAKHPVVAYLAYWGLLVVGSGHTVWGMAKWLGHAPATRSWQNAVVDKATKRQRRRKWLTVHGVAAAVTAAWAVGGLAVVARGGLQDGWVGKVYDELFARVW